jgi:hypothetical protein
MNMLIKFFWTLLREKLFKALSILFNWRKLRHAQKNQPNDQTQNYLHPLVIERAIECKKNLGEHFRFKVNRKNLYLYDRANPSSYARLDSNSLTLQTPEKIPRIDGYSTPEFYNNFVFRHDVHGELFIHDFKTGERIDHIFPIDSNQFSITDHYLVNQSVKGLELIDLNDLNSNEILIKPKLKIPLKWALFSDPILHGDHLYIFCIQGVISVSLSDYTFKSLPFEKHANDQNYFIAYDGVAILIDNLNLIYFRNIGNSKEYANPLGHKLSSIVATKNGFFILDEENNLEFRDLSFNLISEHKTTDEICGISIHQEKYCLILKCSNYSEITFSSSIVLLDSNCVAINQISFSEELGRDCRILRAGDSSSYIFVGQFGFAVLETILWKITGYYCWRRIEFSPYHIDAYIAYIDNRIYFKETNNDSLKILLTKII